MIAARPTQSLDPHTAARPSAACPKANASSRPPLTLPDQCGLILSNSDQKNVKTICALRLRSVSALNQELAIRAYLLCSGFKSLYSALHVPRSALRKPDISGRKGVGLLNSALGPQPLPQSISERPSGFLANGRKRSEPEPGNPGS
jgi:hypothetical protein